MVLTHTQFFDKWLWKRVKEPWFAYECVALIKKYYNEVFWYAIKTFWGSAKTGRENKSNTFPDKDFLKNPWTILPGDIIFFDKVNTQYRHVAIVDSVQAWIVFVIEQNWEWTGKWTGNDAIRKKVYYISDAIGRIRYRKNVDADGELLEEMRKLWVRNGLDSSRPATRGEVAIMIWRLYRLIAWYLN